MATKEETLKLKIKLENAQTIQELEEVLSDINEELGKVEEGSEAFEDLEKMAKQSTKELDEVNKSVSKLNGQTQVLEKGMEGLNSVTEMFGVSVSGLTDGLKKAGSTITTMTGAMKGASAATTGTSKAMRILKTAIAATGIGALVLALVGLITYFTKTQKGADMLSRVMSRLGATVDVIVDRFSKLGEGLLALFSGDLSGSAKIFKEAISGIGEEISKEATEAGKLTRQLQQLEDREISLIATQEKRRAEVERLKLAVEENASNATKAAGLLRKAMEIENQIANDSIGIEKERARIINARLQLGESSRDDMREAAEANANVIRLEAERSARLKVLSRQLKGYASAQNTATESVKKYKAEVFDDDEESLEDDIDPDMQRLIDEGQAMFDEEARMNALSEEEANRHAEAMVDAELWRAKKVEELEASSLEVRKQLAKELYGNLLDMAQSFFSDTEEGQRKAFEFNKAVQTAETIALTYLAAQKAYASQIIPGDPSSLVRGTIAAGLAIASGLARVVQIQKTKFNSTSVESTSAGGSVGGGPQQSFQPIAPIVNTQTGQRETRVFVTETDIRTVTDNVDLIIRKATVVP